MCFLASGSEHGKLNESIFGAEGSKLSNSIDKQLAEFLLDNSTHKPSTMQPIAGPVDFSNLFDVLSPPRKGNGSSSSHSKRPRSGESRHDVPPSKQHSMLLDKHDQDVTVPAPKQGHSWEGPESCSARIGGEAIIPNADSLSWLEPTFRGTDAHTSTAAAKSGGGVPAPVHVSEEDLTTLFRDLLGSRSNSWLALACSKDGLDGNGNLLPAPGQSLLSKDVEVDTTKRAFGALFS